ncbi:unnamed protein product [Effrenium voratum]|nr:unnamed protein product [Effrenium voratum]
MTHVMHHYWVKEAGDAEAVGEYFPTGDERYGVPVYRNQHGLILSREAHKTAAGGEDTYSWVIGSLPDRRPLYGVQSDDLSAPTLGWQAGERRKDTSDDGKGVFVLLALLLLPVVQLQVNPCC